jgi:acyl dehydratase
MIRRYYDDLTPGEVRTSGTLQVKLDDMLEFARRYDPQYFHTDSDAARDSIFGGLVASGVYTMALWRRLDHEIAMDIAWICGIAWEETRWPVALRAGNTIRARATCLSKRRSDTRADRGVVVYLYELLNEHDQTVFSTRSINLIEIEPSS